MSKKKEAPLLVASVAETWYKVWCPHCRKTNWVNNGDTSDICGTDVGRVLCRACEKVFLLSEGEEGLENFVVTEGMADP